MKLYRTIALFDVIVAANTPEDARETLAKWQHGFGGTEEPLAANECTATEIRREVEVREAMRAVKPLVGETITDAEFEQLKGKTNLALFQELHTKQAK